MTSAIHGQIVAEILPGVYHCKQDLAPVFPGTWAAINLVVGQRIAIVDTGLPGGEALVWPLIASLGRSPTDVVAIINTHFHGDHTGSNGALRAGSQARVMIHGLDAARLGSGELEGPTAGPADVALEDATRIDLGDRELRIVHLPGHTPGSIGVHLPGQKVLFTGDSLQARGTAVQYIASYADPDAYVSSVRRVLGMDIDHLVPGHAFAPFKDSHIHDADVGRFLDISLAHALELDGRITDVLSAAAEPLESSAVATGVCAVFGFGATSPMAIGTVEAHLKRLLDAGVVAGTPHLAHRSTSTATRWALL